MPTQAETADAALANLAAYPVVARARSAGRVRLHGWVYDLVETLVRVYDPARGTFVLPEV